MIFLPLFLVAFFTHPECPMGRIEFIANRTRVAGSRPLISYLRPPCFYSAFLSPSFRVARYAQSMSGVYDTSAATLDTCVKILGPFIQPFWASPFSVLHRPCPSLWRPPIQLMELIFELFKVFSYFFWSRMETVVSFRGYYSGCFNC